MQLGVKDQYFFMMNVGGFSGGLSGLRGAINGMPNLGACGQHELYSIHMTEEAHGNLPTLNVKLLTQDQSLMAALNEGAPLMVQYGQNPEEAVTVNYMTVKTAFAFDQGGNSQNGQWILDCKAIIEPGLNYMRDSKQEIYKDTTSKDAIKKVASEHFNVVDNVSQEPKDKMHWMKPGVSPYRFVHKTLERSYIGDDNFMMHGIDMRNNFKLTSLKDLSSQPPVLTAVPPGMGMSGFGPTLEYNPAYHRIYQESGTKNHFAGIYKNKYQVYDPTKEENKQIEADPFKSGYISGAHNINTNVPEKVEYQHPYDPRYLHENWGKARLSSRPGVSQFTSTNVDKLLFEHKYTDVSILQNAAVMPPEGATTGGGFGGGLTSMLHPSEGIYMVSSVTRYFAKNRHVTTIQVARDGLNGTQGPGLLGGVTSMFGF